MCLIQTGTSCRLLLVVILSYRRHRRRRKWRNKKKGEKATSTTTATQLSVRPVPRLFKDSLPYSNLAIFMYPVNAKAIDTKFQAKMTVVRRRVH